MLHAPMVPMVGLEPTRISPDDFESPLSSIPAHRHIDVFHLIAVEKRVIKNCCVCCSTRWPTPKMLGFIPYGIHKLGMVPCLGLEPRFCGNRPLIPLIRRLFYHWSNTVYVIRFVSTNLDQQVRIVRYSQWTSTFFGGTLMEKRWRCR